jgi:hypothetical protein
MVRETSAADATHAAAHAARAFAAAARETATAFNAAAAVAFWSAVSHDARLVAAGVTVPDIASSQLWPQHLLGPDTLMPLWNQLEAALLAEKQDWIVWTNWYKNRLTSYVHEEEHELAYVQIDDALWNQGPAVVNAEIKRRIERRAPDVRHPVIAGASDPASRVSATRTGVSRSRRPIFKGFFSYTHRDAEVDPHIVDAFSSELERRVDAKLVNASFEIWRDKNKIQTGDYWDQKIEGAIDASHIFIVVLTPK